MSKMVRIERTGNRLGIVLGSVAIGVFTGFAGRGLICIGRGYFSAHVRIWRFCVAIRTADRWTANWFEWPKSIYIGTPQ